MTSHTKEPWKLLPEECDKPYIRVRGTALGGRYKIANVLTPTYAGVHEREVEETRHNARRIVACVNACAGLETEIVERKVGNVWKLLQQRDELLAALNGVMQVIEPANCGALNLRVTLQEISHINCLLAKAEQ